ncbi:MAG: hypothetical protein HYW63_00380 [Candidatus Levybacteria bacterium]|nr:hypothetical protein [Candidatus Levybacteria bacterium]
MGNSSRFSDGFLLGLIVGGIGVFLLGTKKGNKILKAITEDGFAGLGEIAREIENEAKKGTKTQLNKLEEKIGEIQDSIEVTDASDGDGNGSKPPKPAVKRFFKKSPPKN